MRKRLAMLVAAVAVLAAAGEAGAAKVPIVGTADVCACGGPVLVWWQNLGNGTCLYVYRRDQSPYLDNVIRPC